MKGVENLPPFLSSPQPYRAPRVDPAVSPLPLHSILEENYEIQAIGGEKRFKLSFIFFPFFFRNQGQILEHWNSEKVTKDWFLDHFSFLISFKDVEKEWNFDESRSSFFYSIYIHLRSTFSPV